jgi:hypothetical protein
MTNSEFAYNEHNGATKLPRDKGSGHEFAALLHDCHILHCA